MLCVVLYAHAFGNCVVCVCMRTTAVARELQGREENDVRASQHDSRFSSLCALVLFDPGEFDIIGIGYMVLAAFCVYIHFLTRNYWPPCIRRPEYILFDQLIPTNLLPPPTHTHARTHTYSHNKHTKTPHTHTCRPPTHCATHTHTDTHTHTHAHTLTHTHTHTHIEVQN